MTILTRDSSEIWNGNHFWFMLVDSESDSFGILKRDWCMIPIPHIIALRLIQT